MDWIDLDQDKTVVGCEQISGFAEFDLGGWGGGDDWDLLAVQLS